MVRAKFLFFILLLALTVLAACDSESATEEPQTLDESPITIGASLPLTGRFENPGVATQHGYEVWAAMVNEAGGLLGREVEMVFLDNASDQDDAAADYEQLITETKVDLVVGPFSSFLVIPTSAVAAEHGYAFVEPAGGAPDVFNRGLTNLFFAQPGSSARQADLFAEYLLALPADQRPQTFAVVTQDDPYVLGVMDRLSDFLTTAGIEDVYNQTYPPETTDFSEYASALAELDPDLLLGGTFFNDAVGQVRAYQESDYQPRFVYFTSGPTIPGAFREELGVATEGIFSSVSWYPDSNDFENAEFVSKYVEMFGGTPADIAEDSANAFTVGQVLQQAVEEIQSIDNSELIEELHRGTYNTIVGEMSFDETGAPQGSYMLLQWQGENFVIVGPRDRAEANPIAPPKPSW